MPGSGFDRGVLVADRLSSRTGFRGVPGNGFDRGVLVADGSSSATTAFPNLPLGTLNGPDAEAGVVFSGGCCGGWR